MLNNPAGINSVMPVAIGGSQQPVRTNDVISGFGEVLGRAVDSVNQNQAEADYLSEGLVSGQHANIHETMIAVEKANISFKLMSKVQQKGLDAYQEIMRMQL